MLELTYNNDNNNSVQLILIINYYTVKSKYVKIQQISYMKLGLKH